MRPLTKNDISYALAQGAAPSSDFDLNADISAPNVALKPAAVLVLLQQRGGQTDVVLTKRAAHLNAHPGQIAFAGGKADPSDESAAHTALREAEEEIALRPSTVDILGNLPCHQTVTGFSVTPVVGWIEGHWPISIDPQEVAEVFTVPLAHFTQTANFKIEERRWRGSRRKYYTAPFGPYYIWGATARILFAFAKRFEP